MPSTIAMHEVVAKITLVAIMTGTIVQHGQVTGLAMATPMPAPAINATGIPNNRILSGSQRRDAKSVLLTWSMVSLLRAIFH